PPRRTPRHDQKRRPNHVVGPPPPPTSAPTEDDKCAFVGIRKCPLAGPIGSIRMPSSPASGRKSASSVRARFGPRLRDLLDDLFDIFRFGFGAGLRCSNLLSLRTIAVM